MVASLRQTADLFLRLLFPIQCVHCERLGAPLCAGCADDITRFARPRCPRCDGPRTWRHTCDLPRTVETLCVVGPHADVLRDAVQALKYKQRRDVAPLLATLLARRWRSNGNTVDGIVPVPLGRTRRRDRGYNQAALIARELGTRLSVRVLPALLQRTRETRPQVGLSRNARADNVAGAFAADSAAEGKALLLIDDVCTTGATLGACARALRDAGATAVHAATVTRSVTNASTSSET